MTPQDEEILTAKCYLLGVAPVKTSDGFCLLRDDGKWMVDAANFRKKFVVKDMDSVWSVAWGLHNYNTIWRTDEEMAA